MRVMSSDYSARNVLDAGGTTTGEINRVTHETLGYQGWKLDICPGRSRCIRFFADHDYGNAAMALRAARMARAALLMEEWR